MTRGYPYSMGTVTNKETETGVQPQFMIEPDSGPVEDSDPDPVRRARGFLKDASEVSETATTRSTMSAGATVPPVSWALPLREGRPGLRDSRPRPGRPGRWSVVGVRRTERLNIELAALRYRAGARATLRSRAGSLAAGAAQRARELVCKLRGERRVWQRARVKTGSSGSEPVCAGVQESVCCRGVVCIDRGPRG